MTVDRATLVALSATHRTAGLDDRAAFIHSDWWRGVEGTFDLIVSNPPFKLDFSDYRAH